MACTELIQSGVLEGAARQRLRGRAPDALRRQIGKTTEDLAVGTSANGDVAVEKGATDRRTKLLQLGFLHCCTHIYHDNSHDLRGTPRKKSQLQHMQCKHAIQTSGPRTPQQMIERRSHCLAALMMCPRSQITPSCAPPCSLVSPS